MLSNFMFALNAVMPLVLMMALGFLLRRTKILQESFFRSSDRLVFRIFLPLTLFCNVYSVENLTNINWTLVLYIVLGVLLLFLLSFITTNAFVRERVSRGAAMQCAFRSNTALIGLPLAASLGGAPAAAAMSVAVAFGVPLFNFFAVCVLSIYGTSGQKIDFKVILHRIITNPMIIGCFSGILCLFIRSLIPLDSSGEHIFTLKGSLPFVYSTLSTLGSLATPMSLINIGGLLDFSMVHHGSIRNIIFGCTWRMVLAPAIFITSAALLTRARVLSFTPTEFAVLLPFFGSPVAISSATMASEMGADADLARQYVLWTSLLLMITLPVMIMIMLRFGLL